LEKRWNHDQKGIVAGHERIYRVKYEISHLHGFLQSILEEKH
jgi:hypothetical protein